MAKGKKQPTGPEGFHGSVIAFRDSEQNANDYLDFIQASKRALTQGISLSWGEIEGILTREIGDFNE